MRPLVVTAAALLALASSTVAGTYCLTDARGLGIQRPDLVVRSGRPAYKQHRYDRSLAAFVAPELDRRAARARG